MIALGVASAFALTLLLTNKDFSRFDGLACFGLFGVCALILALGLDHLEEWAYEFSDFIFWTRPELHDKMHEPELRAAFGKLPEDI